MFPTTDVTMVLPAILDDGTRFARDHNRWVKEAIREELEHHHKTRIPGHFKQQARHKYDHATRQERYRAIKAARYRSITDLVKTGRTKKKMTGQADVIRVGGKATDGNVTGTMILRFPFPVSETQPPTVKVSVADMAREIASVTAEEYGQIFRGFATRYLRKLDRGVKPRIRKRILSKHPTAFSGIP